jgi:hypothetical protein
MVDGLRWFLLVGAALSFALSTILYRPIGRPFVRWHVRVFRLPVALHHVLSNDRLVRIFGVGSAGLNLACWWYLGTPDGVAMLRGFGRP